VSWHAWDILCPILVIGLSMTNSEDDEHDIADHGTVIMDRKAASGIPRSVANASRSRPAPPPILPAAGTPPTTPAAPPAAPAGLPVVPASISGVAPSQSAAAAAAASATNKRLAALVAFGSFTVVFVIGALIMILIRVARDSADDAPRSNSAAQTKPASSSRTTSK